MKITSIQCHMVTIPYRNPYRMAPGETLHKKQIVVLIETDEGITGLGETGVTLIERGGETQEAIYITIRKYFTPLLIGMDPFDIGPIIDRLEGFNQGRTGFLCAKAAIDTACYDIMGKAVKQPVAKLLGGVSRTTFRVSRSLGVKRPEEMAADAVRLKSMGYAISVRSGSTSRKTSTAWRQCATPWVPNTLMDVNGASQRPVAIQHCEMEHYGIEAIEQPVRGGTCRA
jgi:L-alanine-DL-glutamate epimerase-like enolase superfamily enzyme